MERRTRFLKLVECGVLLAGDKIKPYVALRIIDSSYFVLEEMIPKNTAEAAREWIRSGSSKKHVSAEWTKEVAERIKEDGTYDGSFEIS